MAILGFGALCFSSLLTIIDPVAVAPFFVTLTRGQTSAQRRQVAVRACAASLAILLAFAVAGGSILKLFGITLNAFRIAGGILFVTLSLRLLSGHGHQQPDSESAPADPALVPLGMPLICGPGAISTVMILMGQCATWAHTAVFGLALLAAMALTCATLLISPWATRWLGPSGIAMVTQLMGLILCVIGIQFILDGLRPVILDILARA